MADEYKLDWGLDCRIREVVGDYLVSSIGQTMLTQHLDTLRTWMFDLYPGAVVGETLVIRQRPDKERFAAITYRSREQAEEGHPTIVGLLRKGDDTWLRPFGLENARHWGHVRRGLLKRLERLEE